MFEVAAGLPRLKWAAARATVVALGGLCTVDAAAAVVDDAVVAASVVVVVVVVVACAVVTLHQHTC
jgi:hypothetical protein